MTSPRRVRSRRAKVKPSGGKAGADRGGSSPPADKTRVVEGGAPGSSGSGEPGVRSAGKALGTEDAAAMSSDGPRHRILGSSRAGGVSPDHGGPVYAPSAQKRVGAGSPAPLPARFPYHVRGQIVWSAVSGALLVLWIVLFVAAPALLPFLEPGWAKAAVVVSFALIFLYFLWPVLTAHVVSKDAVELRVGHFRLRIPLDNILAAAPLDEKAIQAAIRVDTGTRRAEVVVHRRGPFVMIALRKPQTHPLLLNQAFREVVFDVADPESFVRAIRSAQDARAQGTAAKPARGPTKLRRVVR